MCFEGAYTRKVQPVLCFAADSLQAPSHTCLLEPSIRIGSTPWTLRVISGSDSPRGLIHCISLHKGRHLGYYFDYCFVMGNSQGNQGITSGILGPDTLSEDDGTKNRLPLAEGMSLSHWLQGVRCNHLLDFRSSEGLPSHADVVIIGSGVRLLWFHWLATEYFLAIWNIHSRQTSQLSRRT